MDPTPLLAVVKNAGRLLAPSSLDSDAAASSSVKVSMPNIGSIDACVSASLLSLLRSFHLDEFSGTFAIAWGNREGNKQQHP